jgi:hypothetical protein
LGLNLKTVAVALAACATAGGIAAAVIVACIPDLPVGQQVPPPPPPAATGFCGDGIIDLEQGEECDNGPAASDAGFGGCSPACKVLCPGGKRLPLNNHCYRLAATAEVTLSAAEIACTDIGGHVVTFASDEEFEPVAKLVDAVDAGPFWVGIKNASSVVEHEPGWAPTCSGCFAHTLDASAPLPRSDVLPDASEGCIEAYSDPARRSWASYPCDHGPRLRVVCEREPDGYQSKSCDAGTCIALMATLPTKRYVYVAEAVSAANAQTGCAALGGQLVVLQSRDEREQLWRELSRIPNAPMAIWIGLSLSDGGADDGGVPWVWEDGTPAMSGGYPSPWGDGQPIVRVRGTTARAYLQDTMTAVDDTLARNVALPALPAYVCEVGVADGGP